MSGKTENLLAQAKTETEEKTSISSARRKFESAEQAKTAFAQLSEKLLRIAEWNFSSGISTFVLFDRNGAEKDRSEKARLGDFVRIKMPLTGKQDWVKITAIDDLPDELILTVQPSYDPTEKQPDSKVTSHFFTGDSSNNFCLKLAESAVEMYVIGLNEVTNTEHTNHFLESARNLATANLGHYLGIQISEWNKFCRDFIETSDAA